MFHGVSQKCMPFHIMKFFLMREVTDVSNERSSARKADGREEGKAQKMGQARHKDDQELGTLRTFK